MKKLFILSAILMALSGCKKETEGPSTEQTIAPTVVEQRTIAKPGSLPVISLTLTIQNSYLDDLGNTVLYKIRNENSQSYSDGVDYVKAQIDQNGNFSFNTNTSKNSLAKRFIVYDLSDPVDPSNTYSPAFGRGYYYQYNYLFNTAVSQYGTNPSVPLQNLAVGSSECVSMTGNINGDGVNSIFDYTVRFHATKNDQPDSPTAFAVVTRVSDTEWKIEPGSCGASNDIGALWTGDTRNEIAKGYFHLPFSFALSQK